MENVETPQVEETVKVLPENGTKVTKEVVALSFETFNAVAAYLESRPFKEVAHLINSLSQGQRVTING